MQCLRCSHDNAADAVFCDECGARLEAVCSGCGESNRSGAKFCRKCGQALSTAAPSTPSRFDTPQSYTPKHLAEKILTSKAALEGERKQVTVLFADLKGSMELLADRDPEEARKLLDPVLERMMEAVHRYEGTVNQVMGDGIMALFGAPLAHEDHAVRACYAALWMQESVKRYAERVQRSVGVPISIRVGVNSGEVVVRAIGSDLHMDYTAIGQSTHLAARMEQMAMPGSILCTAATLALVEGYVGVKPLGPVPVKGLAEDVEVYEVTGAGPARTRLQTSARRGLTRFVGRDPEVARLRHAQNLAGEGHGQVAAIVGEAGVGKSRLVYEFIHSHRLQDWLTLESASVSYGKGTSYLPVIDLLKGYFKIQDRDDLLLIFEDLHWIDSETQALLDGLVESLGSVRLLLLVNYRPEYQHAWGGKTSYSQMRLDALPAESTGELLEALLGEDPGLAPLKQLLVKRGNPFFLEETVRTLAETKALAGERGRYRLMHPVQTLQVPATVQVMLAARIDRLDPEDKRLLQTASVVGKDVPWALLQPIAELPDETLRRGLDRLQSAEFLYEAGIFPDLEYSFTHALTHEVAYSGLLQERRCALHARIVAAIETLHQDRLGGEVERLAHHALRGQLWEKAAVYCRQAGAKALARSTNREAAVFLGQALAALKHVPETRQTLESGIDVRFDLRAALIRFGEHERIRAYLDEAGRMAETLADPLRIARVSASRGYECWIAAELADALRFGQSAKTVAGTAENLTLQAVTHHNLGLAYHSAGDYSSARDLFRKAVQLIEGAASPEQFLGGGFHPVDSRAWLAFTLAALGEFDEGITQGSEGIRTGERINHHYHLTIAYRCLGSLYTEKGDFDQAIRLLERAVDLSRESLIGHGGAPGTLGYAYARSGRVEEGLSLLCETLTAVEASAARWFHTPLVMQLGEAHLLAGRLQDALALAERAVSLARRRAERGHEARGLRLVGEIVSHEDPLDVQTAGERYRESMALAVQLGMRPLVAHCRLGLGKLYRRTDKRQEAQEHLTTATTMYREMDMRFYLEQAEAAMREMA